MPAALYYLHDPFAPDPNRPTRFGSALVIEAEGKILLQQRKDSFQWGIVSGDIHNTETFKDCAIRKCITETNIRLFHEEVKELKLFDDPTRIVSYLDGNIYRVVSFAYAAKLDKIPEAEAGKDVITLRWVEPEDLNDYNLIVTHREILDYYLETKGLELNLYDGRIRQ